MDKNAIKKYAVWARRELIARVSQKAEQYGITEKEIIDERAENIHGVVLTPAQKSQRQALIHLIRRDGYQQAMEEVAYTWFNRFIALRFMEVNDYPPGHTRAFTDEQNVFKPESGQGHRTEGNQQDGRTVSVSADHSLQPFKCDSARHVPADR